MVTRNDGRKGTDTPSRFWPSVGVRPTISVDTPYSDWCVPHRRVFSAVPTPFLPKTVGKRNHSDWLFSASVHAKRNGSEGPKQIIKKANLRFHLTPALDTGSGKPHELLAVE